MSGIPEEVQDAHVGRLRLEAVIVGECAECGRGITGLDAACRGEVRESDGEEWIAWYHASCIGCDHNEEMRWAGCDACGREWQS